MELLCGGVLLGAIGMTDSYASHVLGAVSLVSSSGPNRSSERGEIFKSCAKGAGTL